MPKALTFALTVIMLMWFALPALAQETQVETNFFEMFFMSRNQNTGQIQIFGTSIIWFLVLLSFVTFGLAGMFVMKYRRGTLIPEEVKFQLEAMLNEKRYREAIEFADSDPSYIAALVSSALNEATAGYPSMERAIEETADMETSRLLRPIEFLNLIGNIAPMLGLFGTVYGMIVAFFGLVQSGGRPDPAELAGGISTALVTTLWGLIVAMPALAAYSIIRNRIDALTSEGLLDAEELIRPFKPGAGKKAAAGGQAPPSGGARPAASPKPAAPRPPAAPKPA